MEWELMDKVAKMSLGMCSPSRLLYDVELGMCHSLRAAELMVNICKLFLKLLHLRSIQNNKPHHLCSKGSHLINN